MNVKFWSRSNWGNDVDAKLAADRDPFLNAICTFYVNETHLHAGFS